MEQNKNRPLSPHIQIYKLQISSAFSILHRMTGVFLYLGLLLLIWFIVLEIYYPNYMHGIKYILNSVLGIMALFAWSVALYYHTLNGIRHLVWDTGRNLSIRGMNISALLVTLFTALLTMLSWGFILSGGSCSLH